MASLIGGVANMLRSLCYGSEGQREKVGRNAEKVAADLVRGVEQHDAGAINQLADQVGGAAIARAAAPAPRAQMEEKKVERKLPEESSASRAAKAFQEIKGSNVSVKGRAGQLEPAPSRGDIEAAKRTIQRYDGAAHHSGVTKEQYDAATETMKRSRR